MGRMQLPHRFLIFWIFGLFSAFLSEILGIFGVSAQNFGLKCQKSNIYYPKSELHLHHEPPYEFNVVCDSFIKMKGLELSIELFKEGYDNELEFSNIEHKYEFLKYHAKILNDGHVSLIHKNINQKLGSSYQFKNDNVPLDTSSSNSTVQLNLFNGDQNGIWF